jgi:hypothetical protein
MAAPINPPEATASSAGANATLEVRESDRVRAGTLVPLLADVPTVVFETRALWPQTSNLPLRVRFAIDALTAAPPGRPLDRRDGLVCAEGAR